MKSHPRSFAASVCAAAALLTMVSAQAQSVRAVPNTAAPSAAARAGQATPNPAGLRAPFPAGLTSGSGSAVSTDPVAASTAASPNPNAVTATTLGPSLVTPDPRFANNTDLGAAMTTTPPTFNADGTVNPAGTLNNPATAVLGGAPGYGVARGPAQNVPSGGSGMNNVEIARLFMTADGNGDGELSRGEASRLRLPQSFEEMDRNFDGVITRFEYEDGMR